MDFSTMKDKIRNNDYNTVTEFKVRIVYNIFIFKLRGGILNMKYIEIKLIEVYVNICSHNCWNILWLLGGF